LDGFSDHTGFKHEEMIILSVQNSLAAKWQRSFDLPVGTSALLLSFAKVSGTANRRCP
jgi:hypothetical protein